MLEVMIAIAIILASVSASTTLIISTSGAGRVSQSNIEATNLAREGVEIVQIIRDSNWLKRDQNIGDDPTGAATPTVVQWDECCLLSGAQNLGYQPMGSESDVECSPAQPSALERFRAQYNSNAWTLVEEYQGNRCNNTIPASLNNFIVYRSTSPGFPVYTQNSAGGAVATKYRRIINVTKGYERQTAGGYVDDVTCPATATNVCLEYLLVTSEVFWRDRTGADTKYAGFNRRVTVEKRLYNWR